MASLLESSQLAINIIVNVAAPTLNVVGGPLQGRDKTLSRRKQVILHKIVIHTGLTTLLHNIVKSDVPGKEKRDWC